MKNTLEKEVDFRTLLKETKCVTVNLVKVKLCGKRLGLVVVQIEVLCSSTEQI